MNLTEQTVSGNNQISLQDSLNAALLKIKVAMTASTIAPIGNNLIVYVDRADSSTPTADRKQYVFNMESPLKYCDQIGDELLQQFKAVNNDIYVESFVKRLIGTDTNGNYILEDSTREELDAIEITLFEGTNYIYTNYANASIMLIYPKNNEQNKCFLNNAIYNKHKTNNVSEFSLDDLYFKDAFTKTENSLNLEINNISADCLISKNNKFSLDSQGNLIVNSISVSQGLINNANICNLIYPVGSIYLAVNSTNPSTLFGGSWTQISDKFIVGAGSVYGAGSIGGSSSHSHTTGAHALTISEMPSHTHIQDSHSHTQHPDTWMNRTPVDGYVPASGTFIAQANTATYYTGGTTATNQYTGGSGAHSHGNTGSSSNLPPYLAVYIWKRTA